MSNVPRKNLRRPALVRALVAVVALGHAASCQTFAASSTRIA